ncbi:LodA/GoxA family CTQ-dependent oxidase [Planktotalea sp.]|uniref:LodA/GoxA family CTQ-dependent oxidase n=1 Tax=Planktotalea sp. TaxID=2029877 RepID=UPI00329705EA
MTNALVGVSSIKIGPGIGMARVGNSTLTGGEEYFIGPETPGVTPSPATTGTNGTQGYKDGTGALKRQAQRFRVFGYDCNGGLLGEITAGSTVNGSPVNITWDVHVTNMKAANYSFQGKYAFDPSKLRNSTIQPTLPPHLRDKLIIDPGSMSISGPSQGPVELNDNGAGSTIFDISAADTQPISSRLKYDPPATPIPSAPVDHAIAITYSPATVSLGRLYTDDDGRLIFVGGEGRSESCTTPSVVISKVDISQSPEGGEPNPEYNGNSYFNNPGWFDDTCGGSVNCTVISTDGTSVQLATDGDAMSQGWVAVAPPHYAPASINVVSLLDLQMDIYPEADPYTGAGPLYFYGGQDAGIQSALSTTPDFSDLNIESAEALPVSLITSLSATVLDGTPYLAASDQNGDVYFGSLLVGSPVPFAPVSGAQPAVGPGAVTVFQNRVFHVYQSETGLMTSLFTPSTGQVYAPLPVPITTNQAGGAATTTFNGQVYVGVLSGGPEAGLYIGNSKTTNSDAFTFNEVPLTNGIYTPEMVQAPVGFAMSVHRNKLYIAYVDSDNMLSLAVSADGATFTSAQVQVSGAAVPVSSEIRSLALTSFDGQMYICYSSTAASDNYAVLSSKDGKTFTTHGTNFASQTVPAAATNVPVNFYRDIYPILKTVTDYAWTNERAFHGHRPGATGDFLTPNYLLDLESPELFSVGASNPKPFPEPSLNVARSFVYGFIRPPAQEVYIKNIDGTGESTSYDVPPPPMPAVPDALTQIITSAEGVNQRADLMPRLFGNGGSPAENTTNGTTYPNQWLPLTDHQLEKFQHWVNGNFQSGDMSDTAKQYTVLANGSPVPEPDQLSIAALQPTVGGGFHPGIELTYLMHEETFFEGPFRFAQGTIAGSIAAYMSIPWQGDFWSCNISWWPALRPDITVTQSDPVVSPGQDPNPNPVLTHQPWFRGARIPPDSDNISDYEGGYSVMIDDWYRLGLVTPVSDSTDQGEQVFAEVERDPSLNVPSLLISVADSQVATGQAMSYSGSAVATSATDATQPSQAWTLSAKPAAAGQIYIAAGSSDDVLTVDFATGSVSLAPKLTPADDSQIWTYVSSGTDGYPGHFNLVSKINLQLLTTSSPQSISTASSGTGDQLWALGATNLPS